MLDAESLETLERLQVEEEYNQYISMNEEDARDEDELSEGEDENEPVANQSDTQQTQALLVQPTQGIPNRRKRRLTSDVWDEIKSVGVGADGKERGKCVYCGAQLVINTKTHGTNHLRRHLQGCVKNPNKKKDGPVYNEKVDRDMMSEVIIYHDLPFRYCEYEKVRERDLYLNPNCQPICRQTAALDVFRKYKMEKLKLKEVLRKHSGRICFTSDLWTAEATVMGYMCLTAHFIDAEWRLHSKILAFCDLKSPHTGEAVANCVLDCMKEWDIDKKVFSITLDNVTNNGSMVSILKDKVQMISGSGLLCDGKFIRIRCCAHILNLIVKDGLALARDVLHNIRESVRYVKAAQSRIEAFAVCAERVGISDGAGLSLDVKTRWNSTYLMLVRALRFRRAFASMKAYDPNYKFLPSEEEWNRGEKISVLLKPFSVITTHFSCSKYPTSDIYFTQVWRIELLLMKFASCDDVDVKNMAQDMKVKFDKYWKKYSPILAMGAVLDPRMKLELLEVAYEKVDSTTSKSKVEELRRSMTELYEDYRMRTMRSSTSSSSGVSVTPTPHELVTESPLDDFDIDLLELEQCVEVGVGNTKSHLDIYLSEPILSRKAFPKLDVLDFWKENEHRFGELASMARDLLSIPITTVASESAFSIGSRVLTPYRNRLLPKKVQALLCIRNWLRGFADYEGTIQDGDEEAKKKASTSGVETRSGDSCV